MSINYQLILDLPNDLSCYLIGSKDAILDETIKLDSNHDVNFLKHVEIVDLNNENNCVVLLHIDFSKDEFIPFFSWLYHISDQRPFSPVPVYQPQIKKEEVEFYQYAWTEPAGDRYRHNVHSCRGLSSFLNFLVDHFNENPEVLHQYRSLWTSKEIPQNANQNEVSLTDKGASEHGFFSKKATEQGPQEDCAPDYGHI